MLTPIQQEKVSRMVDKFLELTTRKYPEFATVDWLEKIMRKSDLRKYGKEVLELSIHLMRERKQ